LDIELQSQKDEERQKIANRIPINDVDKDVPMEDGANGKTIDQNGSIKLYFDLWKKISEAKFNWNYDLYSKLDNTADKVKQELVNSTLIIERKKIAIKTLISQAFAELRNNNYNGAAQLYSQISDMWNKFPDYFLEEKKEFNKDIFQLFEQLHDQIDSKFIIDFKTSLENINVFISDAFSHLSIDIDKAKNFYEKALKLYNNIPRGFLPQKLELGRQLLILYKDLSVQTRIGSLQEQLSRKPAGNTYNIGEDKIDRLSEIFRKKNNKSLERSGRDDETLFRQLRERKLDQSKENMKRGLYLEAKSTIDAILKIDPNDGMAKELSNKIPIED